MGTHETVTLRCDLTAHEVASGWPADDLTWINNVREDDGAVSCLLTRNVGEAQVGDLALALLEGFQSVERVAWTRLQNTSDACTAVVYDRAGEAVPESLELVLRVSTGVGHWRLAREAVRQQADVPVRTWYEITDGESAVRTCPREETPY